MDPNPNVLAHASARLPQFDVHAVEADVLKALPLEDRFASAALNLVLHCLPGPMPRKASAVANVAAVLDADGREVLAASFPHVEVEAVGSVAYFRVAMPSVGAA